MGCFAGGSFTVGFFSFFELPAAGFAVVLFDTANFVVALFGAADFAAALFALLPVLVLALDETVLAGDFAAGFLSGFFAVAFEDFFSVFFAADLLPTLLVDTVFALTFFALLAGAPADFATGFAPGFSPGFCWPPTSERMNFLTLNPDFSAADFAAGFFDRSVDFVVLFELTAILLSCPPWVGLVTANR